jgi:hypothetical protein
MQTKAGTEKIFLYSLQVQASSSSPVSVPLQPADVGLLVKHASIHGPLPWSAVAGKAKARKTRVALRIRLAILKWIFES